MSRLTVTPVPTEPWISASWRDSLISDCYITSRFREEVSCLNEDDYTKTTHCS